MYTNFCKINVLQEEKSTGDVYNFVEEGEEEEAEEEDAQAAEETKNESKPVRKRRKKNTGESAVFSCTFCTYTSHRR